MKKIKLFSAFLITLAFVACDKEDAIINNVYDGAQIGLGFTSSEVETVCGWNSGSSVGVKTTGATMRLTVQTTMTSSEDRTFTLSANPDLSTGSAAHYSFGDLTIPADSYDGTAEVYFYDDGTLIEGDEYVLVVEIDLPEGFTSHTSSSIELSYNKYQLCNDYTLTMNELDGWGSERTWEITDPAGDVVASGGPYTDGEQVFEVNNITLADGAHTLTMFDSYGDGNWNGVVEGNFSLDCGISNAASGVGNWGYEISLDFCVNP
jgi:hypothetical protein